LMKIKMVCSSTHFTGNSNFILGLPPHKQQ
jgi:hypothetical protein